MKPKHQRDASKQSSFLKRVDIYGAKPDILFKGEKLSTSGLGGLVTIFAYSSYLFCVGFIVWRYFQRDSSETNVNRIFVKDPEGFSLTKQTFPFAFGVQNVANQHFIDPAVYKAEAVYKVYRRKVVDGVLDFKVESHPLELVSCDQVGLDPAFFSNVDFKNMLCLKEFSHPTLDLKITGEFESDLYSFLSIAVKRCSGAGCKSDAEVESILGRSFFAMNFMNYATKSSNFSSPVEKHPASIYFGLSTSFSKTMRLRMVDNEIHTVSSLLGYSSPGVLKYTYVDGAVTDLRSVITTGAPAITDLFSMVIRMDQMKVVTKRTYKTVFQYLAELGGLINVVGTLCLLVTVRYSWLNMVIDLGRYACSKQTTVQNLFESLADLDSALPNKKKRESSNEHDMESGTKSKTKYNILYPKKQTDQDDSVIALEPPADNRSHQGQVVEPSSQSQDVQDQTLNRTLANSSSHHLLDRLKLRAINHSSRHLKPPPTHFSENLHPPNPDQSSTSPKKADAGKAVDELVSLSKLNHVKQALANKSDCRKYDGVSSKQLLVHSFFPFLAGKNTSLNKLLEDCQEKICKKLDFTAIINAIIDVQKFKMLLLPPEHRLIFDYLPIPDNEDFDEIRFALSVDAGSAEPRHRQATPAQPVLVSPSEDPVLFTKLFMDSLHAICLKESLTEIDKHVLLSFGYLLDR